MQQDTHKFRIFRWDISASYSHNLWKIEPPPQHLTHILILHKNTLICPPLKCKSLQNTNDSLYFWVSVYGGLLACVGRSKALEQWSFYCATWIRPFFFHCLRTHSMSRRCDWHIIHPYTHTEHIENFWFSVWGSGWHLGAGIKLNWSF